MDSILKTCVAVDETGLAWATSLTGEVGMQAAPVHDLVISNKTASRLDDLTDEDEAACWRLAVIRAKQALQEPDIQAVGFLVNDGLAAGQTVGHVHIHVIGFHSNKSQVLIGDELGTLSQKFLGSAMTYPLAYQKASVTLDDFSSIRAARRSFGNIPNAGFSVFTEHPLKDLQENEPIPFVVECWSPETPRTYGLTNLLRVFNGFRESPYNWPAKNLERIFAPLKSVSVSGQGSVG